MKQSVLLMSMVAAWCSSMSGWTLAETTVPPEIITARREFSIPFRYDRRELNRLGARAVVLSVSRDAGTTWKQVHSVPISDDQFRFQAAEDGEYWFSVGVQGADNQLHPQPHAAPAGLKVVVDHTQPQIQLRLTNSAAEQLELHWAISDNTLDLSTLQMEYRYSPADSWKQVYITAQAQGRTAWKIPVGVEPEVRCRISDRAGNKAEQTVRFADTVQPASATVAQPQPVVQPRSNALPQISPAVSEQVKANRPDALPEIVSQSSSEKRAAKPSPSLAVPAHPPIVAESAKPVAPVLPQLEKREQISEEVVDADASLPLKHVPTRAFQIDYQVTGAGPSGIGVVEVYITQDNGNQWWRYGVDPDRQSPMEIRVPADGRYGFCVRIHSGVGNAEPPPQPGDRPQVEVQVDTTPPHIKVTQTAQGRGVHLREVTIDWDFMDDNPTDAPLELFIAGSAEGPWTLIDNELVDRGTHTFQLPANPPAQLFVKLRGTDLAGNTSEAVSATPILLDLARPTARILMVDPVK